MRGERIVCVVEDGVGPSWMGGEEIISLYNEGLVEFDDAELDLARWGSDLTGLEVTTDGRVDTSRSVVEGEFANAVGYMRVCQIVFLGESWCCSF